MGRSAGGGGSELNIVVDDDDEADEVDDDDEAEDAEDDVEVRAFGARNRICRWINLRKRAASCTGHRIGSSWK